METGVGEALSEALVAVYAPYVRRTTAPYGMVDGLEAAIEEGTAYLRRELGELLSKSFAAQSRSPLQVFQSAMAYPTEVLRRAGIQSPARDSVAAAALPGDLYDLGPASSQALGSNVWELHMAWGVAKASALRSSARPPTGAGAQEEPPSSDEARRSIALLSTDLMDRSRIEPAVDAAGYRLVRWRRVVDIQPVAAALVDLTHAAAIAALEELARRGIATVAFGPHVDELAMESARSSGAGVVLSRARFFRELPEILDGFAPISE